MLGGREIRTKIMSTQNMKKITQAMQLVAASKMQKARLSMESARPYASYVSDIISRVRSTREYKHPYFQIRNIKRVGIIVVSTNRGLCGGLNTNLFRKVLQVIMDFKSQKVEVDLCLIGLKAESYFKQLSGINIISVVNFHSNDEIHNKISDVISVMLALFKDKTLDALKLFSNIFINTINHRPSETQLLPIIYPKNHTLELKKWDYIYESEALIVLNFLSVRYIESQTYCAVVENCACEQAARMLAMKNATDNASDVINKLNLDYNKGRQALITQELAEIVSGAASV